MQELIDKGGTAPFGGDRQGQDQPDFRGAYPAVCGNAVDGDKRRHGHHQPPV